jgi:hypothetical protein
VSDDLISQLERVPQQLKRWGEARVDNLSITIEGEPPIDEVRANLGSLIPREISPEPDPRAIENLKFSEALPRPLADRVFCARFNDEDAIGSILAEPVRVVSEV